MIPRLSPLLDDQQDICYLNPTTAALNDGRQLVGRQLVVFPTLASASRALAAKRRDDVGLHPQVTFIQPPVQPFFYSSSPVTDGCNRAHHHRRLFADHGLPEAAMEGLLAVVDRQADEVRWDDLQQALIVPVGLSYRAFGAVLRAAAFVDLPPTPLSYHPLVLPALACGCVPITSSPPPDCLLFPGYGLSRGEMPVREYIDQLDVRRARRLAATAARYIADHPQYHPDHHLRAWASVLGVSSLPLHTIDTCPSLGDVPVF